MAYEVYWDANTKRVIYRTWDGLVYLKYVSQSPLSIQIKNIAAGGADSMAIDHYGRMWGWGYNLAGEIGNYSTFSEVTPVSIHGNNKTFCMVQGSQFRAMGLEYNGMIWGWDRIVRDNLAILARIINVHLFRFTVIKNFYKYINRRLPYISDR